MSAVLDQEHRIVPMQECRLAEVMDIERRAYPFPWTEGNFRDCLKAGYSAWLLCSAEGTTLGYSVMSMAVGEAHLLNVAIDPTMRGCGLGRDMLEHNLHIARAAHCTAMFLEVRRSNRIALEMYRSKGFERVGTRKGYYPGYAQREDAFVLTLNL